MTALSQATAKTATTSTFDVAKVRADFPILSRQVHGKPLVYPRIAHHFGPETTPD